MRFRFSTCWIITSTALLTRLSWGSRESSSSQQLPRVWRFPPQASALLWYHHGTRASHFCPPFQSFTTTYIPTIRRFRFSRDHSCCKRNNLVFSFPSPYNSSSSSPLWSTVSAATMHLLVLPSHIFVLLWGILYTTTPNIWGELCKFSIDLADYCLFRKAQNHCCSIKAIVTTLLAILYIPLAKSFVWFFFNQNLISAVGFCTILVQHSCSQCLGFLMITHSEKRRPGLSCPGCSTLHTSDSQIQSWKQKPSKQMWLSLYIWKILALYKVLLDGKRYLINSSQHLCSAGDSGCVLAKELQAFLQLLNDLLCWVIFFTQRS